MTTIKRRIATEIAGSGCSNCGKRHRVLSEDQCADRKMSEKTLQDRVIGRAKRRGWKVMHVGKGIAAFTKAGDPIFITASSAGWPDLTLAKDGHRLIFMELKKELGEVAPEQWEWLRLLNMTGTHAVIIRPSDLRAGRVNAIISAGSPL